MTQILQVKTKKQQKEFLEFPLKLYKGEKNFTPPLYSDEKAIFSKDYPYYKECEAVYFNAYENGKIVGRISGIIQRTSNEIRNQKRVRFTRFDVINDFEVAKALFNAVEKWAIEKNMDTVCGPLGFSSLERQGLLVEGFDVPSTFEEQYNYEYYRDFLEKLGYVKEADWLERTVKLPSDDGERLLKLAEKVENHGYKRYPFKSTKELVAKCGDGFWELFNKRYTDLYGVVPISKPVGKMLVKSLSSFVNIKYCGVALNEQGEVISFALCFPSIADAVKKSGGKLTPLTLIKVLKALRKPKVLELGLIAVDTNYLNRGIAVLSLAHLVKLLRDNPSIRYVETNMNLEDNVAIQSLWDKHFDSKICKRRRSYVKKLK